MIKIPNVDFIIPFKSEDQERIIAYQTVIRYLEEFFETNIYDECGRLRHPDVFNKSYHVNWGVKMSKNKTNSPILCIHDADVFLRPFQHLTAIKLLEEDKFDVVVPHNGYIYELLKDYHHLLFNNAEFIFDINKQMVLRNTPRGFGGVFYVKRDFFNEIGMMNEDLLFTNKTNREFLERAIKLGARTGMVTGPIIHLSHKDTKLEGANKELASLITVQNYKERLIINKVTIRELKHYIASWSWVGGNKK